MKNEMPKWYHARRASYQSNHLRERRDVKWRLGRNILAAAALVRLWLVRGGIDNGRQAAGVRPYRRNEVAARIEISEYACA